MGVLHDVYIHGPIRLLENHVSLYKVFKLHAVVGWSSELSLNGHPLS